jgi:hypothetical protein
MDGGVPPPTTVAAAARPVRSSVVPSESLLLSGPGVARPNDVCPEQRPAGLERSGVVAVVDTASRHATASVTGVQQAVSTHPVSASGIRLSGRPVSGHLGRSSTGSGARPSAVHPSSVQPSAVQPSAVQPSVRTRPSPSHSGGGVGDQVEVAGDPDHRNRWRPQGLPGRRWLDRRSRRPGAGDAAHVALVGGRPVADLGRRVGCGPRRPHLTAERPGRPGRGCRAPVAGGGAAGTGTGCNARWLHRTRGWRPRAGCATTLGGRRRA